MNTVDTVFLIIIGFFVLMFALKGIKKIFFTMISMAFAILIAKLIGTPVGKLLVTEPLDIDFAGLDSKVMSKVNDIFPLALGTAVVFLLTFLVTRVLLKIIEYRIGTGFFSMIINKLIGALAGFIFGVALVFALSTVLELVEATSSIINFGDSFLQTLNESEIYSLFKSFKY